MTKLDQVLSIDLGGTKLHAAIINKNGEILVEKKIKTETEKGAEGLLKSIKKLIRDFIDKDYEIDTIAIASAGRINFETGKVYYATDNLPNWSGTDLRGILEKEFGLNIIVENDVNAAGLGEMWMGNASDVNSSICITLGTGIAGAIIINKQLIRGAHWSAGEIGHMIIHPQGRKCNCGLSGCFEQYCSGTALVNSFNNRSKFKIKDGYEFFELVNDKDKLALDIIDKFTDDLALSIVMLSNIIDPDAFIIGGGLINTKEYWWDSFINKVNNSPLSNIFVPEIKPAKFKNYAGLYGMAYLYFYN